METSSASNHLLSEDVQSPGWNQCRFCLENVPVEELISPCKCGGTVRFVHLECLRHWQREVGNSERATICQVCRGTFSVAPIPTGSFGRGREVRPLFEMVHTNPLYDDSAARNLPRNVLGQIQAMAVIGSLVVHTANDQSKQFAARRKPIAGTDFVSAVLEATLATRLSHWDRGVFLLAAGWEFKASDGSTALMGVNLAGAATETRLSFRMLQERLRGAPLHFRRGGPIRMDRWLALVAYKGRQPSPSSLVHLLEFPDEDEVCSGALFGEPDDVAAGHAVWSSKQLVSEVARNRWGLVRCEASDLAALPVGGAQEDRWSTIWQSREVTTVKVSGPPGKQSEILQACSGRCSIS